MSGQIVESSQTTRVYNLLDQASQAKMTLDDVSKGNVTNIVRTIAHNIPNEVSDKLIQAMRFTDRRQDHIQQLTVVLFHEGRTLTLLDIEDAIKIYAKAKYHQKKNPKKQPHEAATTTTKTGKN